MADSSAVLTAQPPQPTQPSTKPTKSSREASQTLFISSLPYTLTSSALSTLFSSVGPIRSAFIACDTGTGQSKGVGYVTFVSEEDAKRALEEFHLKKVQGREGEGEVRVCRVEFAKQRLSKKERAEKRALGGASAAISPSAATATPSAATQTISAATAATAATTPANIDTASTDTATDTATATNTATSTNTATNTATSTSTPTILLSDLPPTLTKKELWKKVRKQPSVLEITVFTPPSGQAEVTFSTPAAAMAAVRALHAHTFKGALISCRRKTASSSSSSAGQDSSMAARVIVRNLDFFLTEQEIKAHFLPFGPIKSITLPLSADGKGHGRGFAFVWFFNVADATAAIKGMNGREIGRGKNGKGRKCAVDWSVAKDRFEAEKAERAFEPKEEQEAGSDAEAEAEAEDQIIYQPGEHDNGSNSSDSEGDGDSNAEDENENENEEKEKFTGRPPMDDDVTLFVRNVPFEATEAEFHTLFRAFGPMRYAKITMDKALDRPRGTGFVAYWNQADAAKVLKIAESTRIEVSSQATTSKNPFAMPVAGSLLTADAGGLSSQSIILQGRVLDIIPAVSRDKADQLKADGEKIKEKSDKRNVYLMREGVVFPNSPAAANMPAVELEKRQQSFAARKALLRTNPALYISKTRLSIRQIPTFVTDRTMRKLAIHSIKSYKDEVARGDREQLSKDELAEAKGKTKIIQSKIIRQQDRIDAATGLGKSKGYGFLEMSHHGDSLRILRWANNNAEVPALLSQWHKEELKDLIEKQKKLAEGGDNEAEGKQARLETRLAEISKGKGRLILEFSVENTAITKKREERSNLPQKRKADAVEEDAENEKKINDDLEIEKTPKFKKSKTKSAESKEGKEKKSDGGIGSIIGRKRMQRKHK